jgi:tetratricopeptide (TPR) repeat protein
MIHDEVTMFQPVDGMRSVGRIREMPPRFTPEEAARLALGRVRKALTAWLPGMVFNPVKLLEQLGCSLGSGIPEIERLLSLGWLHWLSEDLGAAETFLQDAFERSRHANNPDWLAASGYWRARVRLLLGNDDPVGEYDVLLRSLKGSPQATAWFVDLLWRVGRVDRADQVWKSVRSNKKVFACDEGPILEARAMLRRGELQPADKILNEAAPGSGVVQVERLLLQAWIAVALKQPQRVDGLLKQAQKGPYPTSTLNRWRSLLEWRTRGTPLAQAVLDHPNLLSPLLADLIHGQQTRLRAAGTAVATEGALTALQKARSVPAVEAFARYALACMGQDDLAAVLASQPGLFLALRCRVRQAVERFRTRQSPPPELLDTLQQAASVQFHDPATEHFRRLALLLQRREPHLDDLRQAVSGTESDPVQRRNLFRAAVEVMLRRLPVETQRKLLVEWALLPWLHDEAQLRALLARPLLGLVLRERLNDGPERSTLDHLQPGEPLLELLGASTNPSDQHPPAVQLWQAARQLADPGFAETDAENWRQRLKMGPWGTARSGWRSMALVLLVQEAAQRGDVPGVCALLEDADAWRGFRSGPPRGLMRTIAALVAGHPAHPAWKQSLPRWLQVWELNLLGPEGKMLAVQAGLTTLPGSQSEPPVGMPVVPWFLHLASRALGREDAAEALACVRRALAVDPELTNLPEANVVREALPALERLAFAATLAAVGRPVPEAAPTFPGLLVDAVDLLRGLPKADVSASLQPGLPEIVARTDQPARLVHHLALLQLRAAQALEERDQTDLAEPYWRRSWQLWLRWITAPETTQNVAVETIASLLDFLLGLHRTRVNDLLSRNEVDRARRHWNLVLDLPGMAGERGEALGKDLADRLARFRDELSSEYLVTTREAMRYGDIGEGMHADYDKGLTYLRRLLSLDRDSVRLLTALVEVCGEYFLDLYHAGSPEQLVEQVDRFLPFALQLGRLIENQPGALAARAALAEFYKFRGFVTRDREQKKNLYREALRFNPANDNVRTLLETLENPNEEE